MRPAILLWAASLAALVAASLAARATAAEPEERAGLGVLLSLRGGESPSRLEIVPTLEGRAPRESWAVCVNRLFDHFDRDGDAALSRAEAERVPPLPLGSEEEVQLDFSRLDADRDGKAMRAEWQNYCETRDFAPLAAQVRAASDADRQLAATFLAALDADRDGRITAAELREAPTALRRFDLNDDEAIEFTELLPRVGAASQTGGEAYRPAEHSREAAIGLRLALSGRTVTASLSDTSAERAKLKAASAGESFLVMDPKLRWAVVISPARTSPDLASTRDFLLAQLAEAAAGREAVPLAEIECDPALAGLSDLADYADRNGDAKLTAAEVGAWCDLVQAMLSPVRLTLTMRGENLFPLLDRDGDLRLSARELTQAGTFFDGDPHSSVPPIFTLEVTGIGAKSWGGLRIPAAKPAAATKSATTPAAARWFTALDANRDGVVSPREFPGPPEAFRRLDKNADGLLLPGE